MVNHLFLNQSVHAGQFMPSISVLETKEALSFFFIGLYMKYIFCLGMPCVGKKSGFIIVFLISLRKHDLL